MSRLYGGDDRIAAQIVTGIGFLGRGLIFREDIASKASRLSATIWCVAAVGIAYRAEGYIIAHLRLAVRNTEAASCGASQSRRI